MLRTELTMDLSLSPADLAFRAEVRAFIAAKLPQEISETFHAAGRHTFGQMMQWHRILFEKGWVAPHWPVKHGGAGWSVMQQHIFDTEAMAAGAPRLRPFGLRMIGPILIHFGNDWQRARFLPPILSGEEYWCQGFSEPDAGSDLASLSARAGRDGDDYIVTGQKTWTTTGQHADWMFALVRTDPQAERPQQGISMLLIDMKSPGVTVRPIITIDGDHHINDVFLDSVRVPAQHLVGQENKGWSYAKFLLAQERVTVANVGMAKAEIALLKRLARQRGRLDDPVFATRLVDLEADMSALEVTNLRMLSQLGPDGDAGALSSFLKLRGTEIQQRITELAMEVMGPEAAPWRASDGQPRQGAARYGTHGWLFSRAFTVFGGSSEIQKNIVAKQILEL